MSDSNTRDIPNFGLAVNKYLPTTPTDGQVFTWSQASALWYAGTPAGGSNAVAGGGAVSRVALWSGGASLDSDPFLSLSQNLIGGATSQPFVSLIVGGSTAPTGVLDVVQGASNFSATLAIKHTHPSGTHSRLLIQIADGAGGDPFALFNVLNGWSFALGTDNSDGDKFMLAAASQGLARPGIGDFLIVATSNQFVGINSSEVGEPFSVASNKFQVSSAGNLTRIKNIFFDWPSALGPSGGLLETDAAGNMNWEKSPNLNDLDVIGLPKLGPGASARIVGRGEHTGAPAASLAVSEWEMTLFDNGTAPVLRIRYNDAGVTKTVDVGPLI